MAARKTKRTAPSPSPAPSVAAASSTTAAAALPPELQLATADDGRTTIVWAGHDLGDAFALGFLGLVLLMFFVGVGTQLFGWPYGTGGGAAIALVPALPLLRGALGRAVDKTTLTASNEGITIRVGPIRKSSRTLPKADINSFTVRQSEHRASTRGAGAQQLVQRSYAVVAVTKTGDVALVEPLALEATAHTVEHALKRALAGGK